MGWFGSSFLSSHVAASGVLINPI